MFSTILNLIGLAIMAWWILDTNNKLNNLDARLANLEEDIDELWGDDEPLLSDRG